MRIAESVFSLANEYMGVRGYFEEGYSGKQFIAKGKEKEAFVIIQKG